MAPRGMVRSKLSRLYHVCLIIPPFKHGVKATRKSAHQPVSLDALLFRAFAVLVWDAG